LRRSRLLKAVILHEEGEMYNTLKEARIAKKKARGALADFPGLNGVGVTKIGTGLGYGVKVTLKSPASRAIPDEIDGVPVVVEVNRARVPRV
jgi:hypothetical protein